MKERPILFSAPMVRAILEGRKTQTRRVVQLPGWTVADDVLYMDEADPIWPHAISGYSGCMARVDCPYGLPGDRLWVRETFLFDDCRYMPGPMPKTPPVDWTDAFYYRADGECCEQIPECACAELPGKTPWRPSIFMPRWASRITLEVTDVRVQRVQEISFEDAEAEGCDVPEVRQISLYGADKAGREKIYKIHADLGYRPLWDSINAKRGFGWDVNPWVWAITFKRVDGGAK